MNKEHQLNGVPNAFGIDCRQCRSTKEQMFVNKKNKT